MKQIQKTFKFIYLFCGLFLGIGALDAQETTEEALELLKSEALVVRLHVSKPAITELKRLIKSDKLSQKQKDKLQKSLDKRQSDNTEFFTAFIKAFEESYNFGDVVFVPDSLYKEFKEGRRENVFLDKELKLHSNAPKIGDRFVVLQRGLDDLHYEFRNANDEEINGRFPKSTKSRFYNAWDATEALFGGEKKIEELYKKMLSLVKGINNKLIKAS